MNLEHVAFTEYKVIYAQWTPVQRSERTAPVTFTGGREDLALLEAAKVWHDKGAPPLEHQVFGSYRSQLR
jgi:hypothetical protein